MILKDEQFWGFLALVFVPLAVLFLPGFLFGLIL